MPNENLAHSRQEAGPIRYCRGTRSQYSLLRLEVTDYWYAYDYTALGVLSTVHVMSVYILRLMVK